MGSVIDSERGGDEAGPFGGVDVATHKGLWTTITLDPHGLRQLGESRITRGFTPGEFALYRVESCV